MMNERSMKILIADEDGGSMILHTTSFPAVWMSPMCKLIHRSGETEIIDKLQQFVLHKTQEKKTVILLDHPGMVIKQAVFLLFSQITFSKKN